MGKTLKDTISKAMKVWSKFQNNGAQIYCFKTVKMFRFLLTKQKKTSFLKKTKSKLNLGGTYYPLMGLLCKIHQIIGLKNQKKKIIQIYIL